VSQAGDDAEIGRQGRGTGKGGGVTELGDEARGGLGSDATDRREQFANLVRIEMALDVAVEAADLPAQQVEMLANRANVQAVRLAVVRADGTMGVLEQGQGEWPPDSMALVSGELGERSRRTKQETAAHRARGSRGKDGMIDAATRVPEASDDVFRLEIRKLFEDLLCREPRGQQIQHIDDADPKTADTRASSALLGIHRDPIRDFRHGAFLNARQVER